MNTKYQDQSLSNNPFGTLLSKLETETPPTGSATFSNKQLMYKGVRKTQHTPEEIAKAFHYENGNLYFKNSAPGRRLTRPAGCYCKQDSYIKVRLDYELYQAHRIVWCLHYGQWPVEQIDHLNGNRSDNRIENLREATVRENRTFLSKNNKSGVVGISLCKQTAKWRATIYVNGKNIRLGRFSSFDLAVKVRKTAEIEYGFTQENKLEIHE